MRCIIGIQTAYDNAYQADGIGYSISKMMGSFDIPQSTKEYQIEGITVYYWQWSTMAP